MGKQVDDPETRRVAPTAQWVIEEAAWLLLAALPWIVFAAFGWIRTGLFGLHGTVLVYALWRERTRLSDWLVFRTKDALAGAAAGGMILLLGAGYGLALRKVGIELPNMASQLRAIVPSLPLLLAWGALLVPVTEELLFRGRMLRALDGLAGRKVSVVATSAAFMLVHGIPVAFPAYFVFGLIFAFLRRRTGGLVAPIVAHAVNNFLGIAFAGG